ncbi:MAG: transcriptional regulator [Saprospiraceae bacterium]|nr:transcriptional regulator [Saprospiraceae bacterium]
MKEILKDLDKAFENRIRLGIMSGLYVNKYLNYKDLKSLLSVTDGNLASHLKSLEIKGYIRYEKEFLNRKPNTKYFATKAGKKAFDKHIKAIEKLIS